MVERGDPGHIVATYREIAVRFGLGSVNAARTKAKRAGWPEEPTNYPAETKRIRVPREMWDQGGGRDDPITSPERVPSRPHREAASQTPDTGAIAAVRIALDLLRGQLERERARGDAAAEQVQQMRDAVLIAEEDAADARQQVADATRRAEEAERAAVEAWTLARDLAQRLAAVQSPTVPVQAPPGPARRSGWLGRLLGVKPAW